MFKATLEALAGHHVLAAIYTNKEDTSKFSAGFMLNAYDDEVLIGSIDPQGRYDGYMVKRQEDIFLVEQESKYLKKLSALADCNLESYLFRAEDVSQTIAESLLIFAKNVRKCVSVQLLDSGYDNITGLVSELSNGTCIVECVDEYGDFDGYKTFSLLDVTHIVCDEQENASILSLYTAMHGAGKESASMTQDKEDK